MRRWQVTRWRRIFHTSQMRIAIIGLSDDFIKRRRGKVTVGLRPQYGCHIATQNNTARLLLLLFVPIEIMKSSPLLCIHTLFTNETSIALVVRFGATNFCFLTPEIISLRLNEFAVLLIDFYQFCPSAAWVRLQAKSRTQFVATRLGATLRMRLDLGL
jgi:hypothetical protein